MEPKPDKIVRLRKTITPAMQAQICGVVGMGCTLETAADFVGCAPDALYRKMLANREFACRVRKAVCEFEIMMLKRLQEEEVKPQRWRAAAWLLARRFPDRYAEPKAALPSPKVLRQELSRFVDVLAAGIVDRKARDAVVGRVRLIAEALQREAAGRPAT